MSHIAPREWFQSLFIDPVFGRNSYILGVLLSFLFFFQDFQFQKSYFVDEIVQQMSDREAVSISMESYWATSALKGRRASRNAVFIQTLVSI